MNLTGSSQIKQQLTSVMGGTGSGRKGQKTTAAKRTTPSMKTNPSLKLIGNLTSLGFTNGSKATSVTSETTKTTSDATSSTSQDDHETEENGNNKHKKNITNTKFNMIPGLELGDINDKAPVEKPMMASNENKQNDSRNAKTYKIQILYRSQVKKRDVDAVEKMKCLMARLFQYDKTIQMLPYSPSHKSNNPILTTKDIPSEMEEFQIYVPSASVHSRSKTLRMSFKISSELRLWQIKMIQGVRGYLSQYSIYLDESYLVTLDNVKIGGLILSHPQFTRRDTATRDLNKRINENEKTITPIQLSPTNLWNTHGNKISTKVLGVECAKEHAHLVKQRLFLKLLNVPDAMQYSNTRYFKFVPFNANETITNTVLRSGIYLQNKYLIQTTSITIINIHRLDWVVPHNTDTFQALALNVTFPETENKIFTSVEMGVLNNKVHLLTTKSLLNAANIWVDAFVNTMNDMNETKEFWKQSTGFPMPPERIDRPNSTDAQIAYANFLSQSIAPLVGEGYEESGAKTAPTRPSYSRVVYGNTHTGNNNSTNPTQDTEISTITPAQNVNDNSQLQKTMKKAVQNMQEEAKKGQQEMTKTLLDEKKTMNKAVQNMQDEAKKGQQEMRKTLLDEMKQIRQEHTDRTTKIEESVEIFDHMVKELHESNREKSKEMMSYEKKLTKIGLAASKTASKVDDLARSMNNKVDRLSLTMKAFINVMADSLVNGKISQSDSERQRQNLIELSRLLEEEEDQEEDIASEDNMELDDDNEEKERKKRKLKPSPGTGDVLGGEGMSK